jgi:poly-gamma-glutamate synthesis protein (capsule biosynthesis protein)
MKAAERFDLGGGRVRLIKGSGRVKLAAVGDVMLGGAVGDSIAKRGPMHVFRAVKPLLADCEIVFGNLEAALTDTQCRHPLIRHRPRLAPTIAVEALRDAGFTVVSLANNHIFDCLDEGLAQTVKLLRHHGIDYAGAGADISEARTPAYIAAGGIQLGLLAYTYPVHQVASSKSPGCAPNDPKMMLEDVRRVKSRVDHVVVSLHTGPDVGRDFFFYPSLARQAICRNLLAAGATAILCHHCHVPQGIEVYRGGVIAHGLGTSIADTTDWYLRSATAPYSEYIDKGLILVFEFDHDSLIGFEIHPTFIADDLAVQPIHGRRRRQFLEFMGTISEPLYDLDTLRRSLPSPTLAAKLNRLAMKARTVGVYQLAGEVLQDATRSVADRLVLPRRMAALQRRLQKSSTRIPVHPELRRWKAMKQQSRMKRNDFES